MQYVYKYVDTSGNVVYVGITNNLKRRIAEHKTDKLGAYKTVYYFPVNTRGDAEMLETYLINHYGTSKYSNVAKTQKGDFTFLDKWCDELPWTNFTGKVDSSLKPFVISDLIGKQPSIKQQVEIKYKLDDESIDGIINKYNMDRRYLREDIEREITSEERDISEIKRVQSDTDNADIVTTCNIGITLHRVRLVILLGMLCILDEVFFLDREYLYNLSVFSGKALENIELYEKWLGGEICQDNLEDDVIKSYHNIINDDTYKDITDKVSKNKYYKERMMAV